MENLRNRTVVKLVRAGEEAKLRKLLSSPFFASAAVFGERLAGIQMHKESILMNKPVYTGMCILDLSKILMYKFYYRHLKYKYGARCELLYTDTDSLLLEIKTEDIYEDMGRHLELYDTSDYPKDHPLHSQENKKVIGKMKDECNGKPISEVVCLRSKIYSISIGGGENKKKAKGTTKVVTKKEIGCIWIVRGAFDSAHSFHRAKGLCGMAWKKICLRSHRVYIGSNFSNRGLFAIVVYTLDCVRA